MRLSEILVYLAICKTWIHERIPHSWIWFTETNISAPWIIWSSINGICRPMVSLSGDGVWRTTNGVAYPGWSGDPWMGAVASTYDRMTWNSRSLEGYTNVTAKPASRWKWFQHFCLHAKILIPLSNILLVSTVANLTTGGHYYNKNISAFILLFLAPWTQRTLVKTKSVNTWLYSTSSWKADEAITRLPQAVESWPIWRDIWAVAGWTNLL